jgi:anthranilate synthase component 1
MVSEVSGTLKEDIFPYRMLLDSFPAGTLTGAPKHKAMELINQYEASKRNSYGGSIGILGFDGSLDHAIIIRSFLSKGTSLFYQGGAGIVSLSQKENEKVEVDNKMNALRNAILIADCGTNVHYFPKKNHESVSV